MQYRIQSKNIIKKALFIGLGSIGQRHLQNFKEIAHADINIMSYRTSNFNKLIIDGNAHTCTSIAEHYKITEFYDLNKALNHKPDIAFICNPSNLHIKTSIKLALIGTNLFIEKPLNSDTKGLNKLKNIINTNKIVTMVGYQTRFHPALIKVKSIVDKRIYGKIISAEFKWHNFLPKFHLYEDYRISYAARNDLGGGVTLGLSHELDLIQWLFGLPVEVYALSGNSALETNVDETVLAIFKFMFDNETYPVSLSLSYAQGMEHRKFSILMEKAVIECDLIKGYLRIVNHDNKGSYNMDYQGIKRNDLFKKEMKHFLTSVELKNKTDIPLEEGVKSLLMSMAILESIKTGKVRKL